MPAAVVAVAFGSPARSCGLCESEFAFKVEAHDACNTHSPRCRSMAQLVAEVKSLQRAGHQQQWCRYLQENKLYSRDPCRHHPEALEAFIDSMQPLPRPGSPWTPSFGRKGSFTTGSLGSPEFVSPENNKEKLDQLAPPEIIVSAAPKISKDKPHKLPPEIRKVRYTELHGTNSRTPASRETQKMKKKTTSRKLRAEAYLRAEALEHAKTIVWHKCDSKGNFVPVADYSAVPSGSSCTFEHNKSLEQHGSNTSLQDRSDRDGGAMADLCNQEKQGG